MYKQFTANRIQYFKIETSVKLKQAKRSVSLDPKKLSWGFSCFLFTIEFKSAMFERHLVKMYLETYLSAKEQTKSVNQSRKRIKEPTKSNDLKITKEQNVPEKASKKTDEAEESTKDLDAADMAFNSMIAGSGARFDTHIGPY